MLGRGWEHGSSGLELVGRVEGGVAPVFKVSEGGVGRGSSGLDGGGWG